MKKIIPAICCFALAFSLSGCGPVDLVTQLLSVGDAPVRDTTEAKPRVYMDEIKGTLLDFSGDSLTILSEETTYSFDLSQASLECENGMITGDEVTVIYEGQLTDAEDAFGNRPVKVLKVVNDYHMHTEPEENKLSGTLQELSPNRVTLKTKGGASVTFPITGCRQYYSSGIQNQIRLTVHFLGDIENVPADDDGFTRAYHVKTISLSDVEPYDASGAVIPDRENPAAQIFEGTIRDLQMNILSVKVPGVKKVLALDLSGIPAYFPGGPMPGSRVTVSYQGEWNGSTLEGIAVTSVTGEDPADIREYNIAYSITGNIRGCTGNTVTILSTDGAYVTFRTDGAADTSASGMETGADIRVIFNPEENRLTNVLSCIRIEDA